MCTCKSPSLPAAECSAPHRVSAAPQLEEELVQVDKINTQLQLSASDLRLKLRAKEEEIRKEVQKVSTSYGTLPRGG